MAQKETKTNVMRILDSEEIPYIVHTFETEDGEIDGVSGALKCGENPENVFKTLVTVGNDLQHYVFVIPVKEKLDLKSAAKSVGVKSIAMIPQKELFPLTGYIHGGCSPIGMKKKFQTVYDETILIIDHIYVSGGKVGLQIELNPEALLKITEGSTANLVQ